MRQERLNYLILMHVPKHKTDSIDLTVVLNEVVGESEHQSEIFAKY